MRKCEHDYPIPRELCGEDVYDMFYIFDNEQEAIDYVVNTYHVEKEKLLKELYEDENFRKEYGKENYLRSAQIQHTIYLNELMHGEYILWDAY